MRTGIGAAGKGAARASSSTRSSLPCSQKRKAAAQGCGLHVPVRTFPKPESVVEQAPILRRRHPFMLLEPLVEIAGARISGPHGDVSDVVVLPLQQLLLRHLQPGARHEVRWRHLHGALEQLAEIMRAHLRPIRPFLKDERLRRLLLHERQQADDAALCRARAPRGQADRLLHELREHRIRQRGQQRRPGHAVRFSFLKQREMSLLPGGGLAQLPQIVLVEAPFDHIIMKRAAIKMDPAHIPRLLGAAVIPLSLQRKIQNRLAPLQLVDLAFHLDIPPPGGDVMDVEVVQGACLPMHRMRGIFRVSADRFRKDKVRKIRPGQ
ncbi:hypothetical protein BN871_EO_00240 [Paenibacillus sp. P22]|nr:hypothetical protein BN871_EO_00240 [Paenibacillus sp. P22]